NSVCASCHTHSDPIGLSLEGFDTIGRRRSTENGQAIDVSATIQGKSFVGAHGLGRFLHDNPRYPACVARKLYSYAKAVHSQDVGATLALPFLDCLLDGNGQALAATGERVPTRFNTFFYGLGLTKSLWVRKTAGLNYETTEQLEPLEAFKKKMNVFSGSRVMI